ncbi:hypothetical protein EWB00_007553 [Schistosoma japonicum]|uniref:Uncharacterized protein n=1 Tax=Schistosoma japonicum TaxID=6182 RepID=A0A4Z2CUL9_SCHJA|nr:hypothetical protein EWB00_007553 [Schistosoma japonicum]
MRMVCQIALLLSVVMIVSFDASVSGEYNLTKDDVGPFLLGVAMGEASSDESSPVETRGSKKEKKTRRMTINHRTIQKKRIKLILLRFQGQLIPVKPS